MAQHIAALAAAMILAPTCALAQTAPVGEVLIDRARIEISGQGHVRSLPCDGRDVEIAGSDHKVTLTGVCRSLDVSGAANQVTAAIMPGGKIVVAGSDHQVRWQSTGEPQQDLSGVGNKVVRSKP